MTIRIEYLFAIVMCVAPALAGADQVESKALRGCLSAQDGMTLAQALQTPPLQYRCLEWDGSRLLAEALETQDRKRTLGKAVQMGAIHPRIVSCLDNAVGSLAQQLNKSALERACLQRGIATPVLCMLSTEFSSGDCAALGALGKLMSVADGAYAEEIEEVLFRLFRRRPALIFKCWALLEPYEGYIGLGTTSFCSDRREVLRLYRGKDGAANFLRRRAAECGESG